MDAPCKSCTARCVGCHAECERYKQWKTEHNEMTARRRLANTLRTLCEGYRFSVHKRIKKIKNDGGRK